MESELIIKGGTVVTGKSVKPADILVSKGKIISISAPGKLKKNGGRRTIRSLNAQGRIVLPGIIDAHVHFMLRIGKIATSDDFRSGSAAAACGGVTTVIDYTCQSPGIPLIRGLKNRMEEASGKMYVDYSFHCVIPSWKGLKHPARQMKELVRAGVPSFKMFTIYQDRGCRSDDIDLCQALEAAKKCGAVICVHAESEGIIRHFLSRYGGRKELGVRAHALSRPDFTEWQAVQRAIIWSKMTGGRLYFVHLSAGRSAELIRSARNDGANVEAETCPQYLILDDRVFDDKKNGHLFATCPQIKKPGDSRMLWHGLESGAISVIATDNCTFTRSQKNTWKGDIAGLLFGMPGVATLLPLIYTYGVKKKRMDLIKMAELLCSNPARIMGLYPRKGVLKAGSDADMAIIDPSKSVCVDHRKLKHNCDWSPYQGRRLWGFPEYTILRGRVIANDGELTGKACRGKFIRRTGS